MSRFRLISATLAAICTIAAASGTAAAQSPPSGGYTDIHRLGGSTSFHIPRLTNAASVKRMADKRGVAADVRTVLGDSGISQTSDAVVAMLSGVRSSVRGGFCSEATPEDGVLVECDLQPGATIEWMAYRPNIHKGKPAPERLERVRWAGKAAVPAFLFRVTNAGRIYTFLLPKICGNLSLM